MFFILTLLILSGCEPGAHVTIKNNTAHEKHIRVIYPPGFVFLGRDSVRLFQENFRNPIVTPMTDFDTIARTYSFNLPPNYFALVENLIFVSEPTFGQVFIIDEKDTAKLVKRGKDFTKRPKLFLGGWWTYKIKR